MSQEQVEFLISLATNVGKAQQRYNLAKQGYEEEKAKLYSFADWEEILGKAKPTQKDKENAIVLLTADMKKEVDDLGCKLDYSKNILKIHFKAGEYVGENEKRILNILGVDQFSNALF